MEFTENQVYEALGVTPPEADTGEKERVPAEPAPEPSQATADTGEKERVPAEPAMPDAEPDTDAEPGTGAGSGDVHPGDDESLAGDGDKAPLSPEQRKANAAERRRRERQAAVDEAVSAALEQERERTGKELESFFKSAQLVNTITNTPITSMDEFRAWRQSFETTKLQNELKAGKLTPEGLDRVISENPVIKKAEEIIRKDEDEQRRREMAAAQSKIDSDLAEIQKLDPSVKSVGDLLNMPSSKQFYEYVKKGNSFLDAFYLSNRERLQTAAAAAARQQAMTNARGKDHLTATHTRGGGAVSVPADEMAIFRELLPKATEAEIQAYYNKSTKS